MLIIIASVTVLFTASVLVKRDVKTTSLTTHPRGVLLPSGNAFEENIKPVILVFGDSFVIGDVYEGEPVYTGNYTASLDSFDTEQYEVIFVSYLLCDIDIGQDQVVLKKILRSKNGNDCRALTKAFNSQSLLNRLSKVIVVSHTPFRSFPIKFDLVRYLIANSNLNSQNVFVIGNYFNLRPKIDPRCDLFTNQSRSALACIEFIISQNFSHFTEENRRKKYFPSDLGELNYVDPFTVFFGTKLSEQSIENILDNAPYEANGVPFLLDTTHNTSEFIVYFLDEVKRYQGEDKAINNFAEILQ